MHFFEETISHGKFNMNHPKSFEKCLVTFKISQIFPVFQPGKASEPFFFGVHSKSCRQELLVEDLEVFRTIELLETIKR